MDALRDPYGDVPNDHYIEPRSKREWKALYSIFRKVRISDEGKALIELDPNISERTFQNLLDTERLYIQIRIQNMAESRKDWADELLEEEMFGPNLTGAIHLSQCICNHPGGYLCDVVFEYCSDKEWSFITGLIIIKMLEKKHGICRFRNNRWIPWKPKTYYLPPESIRPKDKGINRRFNYIKNLNFIPDPPVCPVCGSDAVIVYRQNRNGKIVYTPCCMDFRMQCPGFDTLPEVKSLRTAKKKWTEFCRKNTKEEA